MYKSFILAVACLLMALPIFAQENTQWSAYLFDYINLALIQVHSEHESRTYSLGIPEGGLVSSLRINEDGSKVAYCYSQPDAAVEWVNKLVIRDILQENNIFEEVVWSGQLFNCAVTAFTNDILALSLSSIANYENPSENWWELRLIDPYTGGNLAVLDSNNPVMPEFTVFDWENSPITVWVYDLSRETVGFIAVPSIGADLPPNFDAFEWNVSADTISRLPNSYGYFNSDYLPETGELVYSVLDESLPAEMPISSIPQANVVKVVDTNGERIIYQNSDWVIGKTTFVNNGQAVLIRLSLAYNAENAGALEQVHYVLVKRDGTRIDLTDNYSGTVFAEAIPNGAIFAYTPELSGGELGISQIFLLGEDDSFRFYTDVTVDYTLGWSPPQLVWTSPSPIASELSPFVGQ